MRALFEVDYHQRDPNDRGDADPEIMVDRQQRDNAKNHPFIIFEIPVEPSLEGTRQSDHAKNRGNYKDDKLNDLNIMQQQHGVVDEAVGQQIRGQRDPRRRHPCFGRARSRNARASKRGETYRRREVGHDAEVEDEEMRGERQHLHADQRRGDDRTADDVVRRSRQPHSEDEAGHHRHHQRQHQVPARYLDYVVGDRKAKRGQRRGADNEPHERAGQRHAEPSARALHKRVEVISKRHPRILFQRAHDNDRHDADKPGAQRGVLQQQRDDDDDHGNQQMTVVPHYLSHGRQFALRNALQLLLAGPDVDIREYRRVVDESRNDRGGGDRKVGDVEELAHDEGSGAHDRRHQLAAGGGAGLDRAGVIGGIPDLFHERDGEGARSRDVGDGRAVDRAEQPGGYDRHLRRAAGLTSGKGKRKLVEKLRAAALREIGAKYDEHDDEGRRDSERESEDALGSQIHMLYYAAQRISAYLEYPGRVIAKIAIEQENHAHAGQYVSHYAASRLEDQQYGGDAEVYFVIDRLRSAARDIVEKEDDVACHAARGSGQQPVVPWRLHF